MPARKNRPGKFTGSKLPRYIARNGGPQSLSPDQFNEAAHDEALRQMGVDVGDWADLGDGVEMRALVLPN